MGRAVSLWELSVGVVLAVVLAGALVVSTGKPVAMARSQRTCADMESFLAAGRQYDAMYGVWPSSWGDMDKVLPQMPRQNLWGRPYVFGSDQRRLWLETDIPPGLLTAMAAGYSLVIQHGGTYDRIRVSVSRFYGQAARLVYEKRNAHVP